MVTKSIPSIITLANLFIGVLAILFIIQGERHYVEYAAMFIISGMLLDALDGRAARLLDAASDFGKELDSLSDIVTFGVAPAVLMYSVVLQDLGGWGMIIAALFPICGAMRLARFSVKPGMPGFFVGLPITAAGGVLATFALFYNVFPDAFLPAGMLVLSFLMISRVKYPNFKKVGIPKRAYWIIPIMIAVVGLLAFRYPTEFPKIVFIPLVLYAIYGLKKSVDQIVRKRKKARKEKNKITH